MAEGQAVCRVQRSPARASSVGLQLREIRLQPCSFRRCCERVRLWKWPGLLQERHYAAAAPAWHSS